MRNGSAGSIRAGAETVRDDWPSKRSAHSILPIRPFAPAQPLTAVSQLLNGGQLNHARPLAPEPAWFLAIGVDATISYIWRALYATDSHRGIALSGLMPAPPSIIQPGGVVRFKVLIVIADEKPKGRLERRPLYYYSTISTMRRVRGSTKTVRPFTTV
jgi:hypothetical protein